MLKLYLASAAYLQYSVLGVRAPMHHCRHGKTQPRMPIWLQEGPDTHVLVIPLLHVLLPVLFFSVVFLRIAVYLASGSSQI